MKAMMDEGEEGVERSGREARAERSGGCSRGRPFRVLLFFCKELSLLFRVRSVSRSLSASFFFSLSLSLSLSLGPIALGKEREVIRERERKRRRSTTTSLSLTFFEKKINKTLFARVPPVLSLSRAFSLIPRGLRKQSTLSC